MMKPVFLIAFCCSILSGFSQVTPAPVEPPVNSTVEQQLENITENNEDMETEDDSYIQELSMILIFRNYRNTLSIHSTSIRPMKTN